MGVDNYKVDALLRDFSLSELLERHGVTEAEVVLLLVQMGKIDEDVLEEETPIDGVYYSS